MRREKLADVERAIQVSESFAAGDESKQLAEAAWAAAAARAAARAAEAARAAAAARADFSSLKEAPRY